MKSLLQSKKTIFIAVLLALVVCCLTVTLALGYQQQAQAASQPVISTDELASEDSSGEYDIMPMATYANQSALQTAINNLANGGTITLDNDVSLTSSLTLTAAKTVNLDLNGHSLTGNGTARIITINNASATFNLRDSKGTGKLTNGKGGVYVAAGRFNMYAGNITGNKLSGSGSSGQDVNLNGGGVYVTNGAKFYMYGGSIDHNTIDDRGGGVLAGIGSYFEMSGGEISYNSAADGGGIYTWEKFVMSGGKFLNNTGSNGGGVLVRTGSFTMSNTAEISGNSARGNGGGIYVYVGTLSVSGAKITNNKAAALGGGIGITDYNQNSSSTLNLSGNVEITGNVAESAGGIQINESRVNFSITGSPVVKDNKTNAGAASNVYLPSNKAITLSGTVGGTNTIGITRANGNFTTGGSTATKAFFSDDANKCVGVNGAALDLAVHNSKVTYAHNSEQHWRTCTHCGVSSNYTNHTYGAWSVNGGSHQRTCSDANCKYVQSEAHNNNLEANRTAQLDAVCAKTSAGTLGYKTYSHCTVCDKYFDASNNLIGGAADLASWKITANKGRIDPTHPGYDSKGLCTHCGAMRPDSGVGEYDDAIKLDNGITIAQQKLSVRIEALVQKGSLTIAEQRMLDSLRTANLEITQSKRLFDESEGYDYASPALDRLLDAIKAASKLADDAFEVARQGAIDAIRKAAQDAKDKVEKRATEGNPDSDRIAALKESYFDLIEREAQRAINDIYGATSEGAFAKTVQRVAGNKGGDGVYTGGTLDGIANTGVDQIDLAMAKEHAKQRLSEAADKVRDAINNSNLAYSLKNSKYNSVDSILEEGYSKVEEQENSLGVQSTLDEYLAKLYALASGDDMGDDALNPDLEAKKDAAKDAIDAKANQAKKDLDGKNLTDEQKQDLKDLIDKEASRAKSEIDNAKTEKGINDAQKQGEDNIDELLKVADKSGKELQDAIDLAKEKSDAKDEIDQAARDGKFTVDERFANGELTNEERRTLKDRIEQKATEAKEQVDDATTKGAIDGIVEKAAKDIDEVAHNQDTKLVSKRVEAEERIRQAAEAAKKDIDSLTDLDDNQRTNLKQRIDQLANQAIEDIRSASTVAEVESLVDEALAAIQETQDLGDVADAANKAVKAAAKQAKEALDKMAGLSETEREFIREKIDKGLQDALAEIDKLAKAVFDGEDGATVTAVEEAGKKWVDIIKGYRDLAQARSDAKIAMDEVFENAKKALDDLKLTKNEYDRFMQEILDAQQTAMDSIYATDATVESIQKAREKGVSDVDDIFERAQFKSEANHAIQHAEQDALAYLNDNTNDDYNGLTSEQKKEFQDMIAQAAQDARTAIEGTVDGQEQPAVDAGRTAIEEIMKLARAKSAANKDIDDAANRAKDKVDERVENGELSKEEGNALKDIINKEAQRAKNHVEEATSSEDIDSIEAIVDEVAGSKGEGDEREGGLLDEIASTPSSDVDLAKAKERAKERLEEAAKKAKDAIDNSKLADKDSAKNHVDELVDAALEGIESANSVDEVNDTLDKALKDIYDYVAGLDDGSGKDLMDPDLEQKKDEAKDEIDDAAEKAKKDVDKKVENGELTPEEGEKAKEEIDKAAKDAKDAIDKANNNDQLEKAKKKGLNAINSVTNPARGFEIGWIIVIVVCLVAVIAALALIIVFVKRKSKRE